MVNDEELLKRLLPMFKGEAQEHLQVISSGLIEMERAEPEMRAEIVETIYRESHSLKGAAQSVNFSHVVAICQAMEDVFSALKREEITPSSNILDLLHNAVDCTSELVAGERVQTWVKRSIGELVQNLENAARETGLSGPKKVRKSKVENVSAQREPQKKEEPHDMRPPAETKITASPEYPSSPALSPYETVRISAGKLDALLLQAEEMLSVKFAMGQLTEELMELSQGLVKWKKGRTRRGPSGKAAGSDSFITSFESRLTGLIKSAEYNQRTFGVMVDSLLDDAKETLMFPVSSLLEMFPKLVRDLSKDAGKQVELTVSGGGIELDRRVLDEIKDPLIHLVRNCIDHGIESPRERQVKKKPPQGKIEIGVSSRDSKIEIAVSDDGMGIDASAVGNAAERKGAVSREELSKLGKDGMLGLIFRSGVTTSPIITDISGRGLGLAIVRESVEKLNGTLSVDTQPDAGTKIRMVVPVSIATFRGVLVRVGEHLFFLPSANTEKMVRAKKEEIQTVENRETILFEGAAISLAGLGDVLELQGNEARSRIEDQYMPLVVLSSAGKRFAFQVDEIIQEQEVLVKSLGAQLARVRNVAGATLLGNGRVVPILNVADLMISAAKVVPAPVVTMVAEPSRQASVLVAEDSITARALLKTILESNGYDVTTAVDGIDALTALKAGEFDLVVSDIDMPRMNGFDLTARIRADRKLSEIPVVLVTALESREDKEHGIDVGANAYIVKSSFEQSNLMEVIGRLI